MRRALLAPVLLAGATLCQGAEMPAAFRPCIDPSNLPFSNTRGEGLENRIAELFAARLGLPVKSYAFPQRMNFIRNTLRYRLPGEDYRCDVVMGIPAGYEQASATAPYYRSTYMLVYPKGNGLDGVKRGADLLALPAEAARKLTIGVYDRSPGATWLARHGWEAQAKIYPILSPDPEQYPGEIVEKDLVLGAIDAAIVWGPIAGYFAKRVRGADLKLVALESEPGVRFDYAIAMGVRYGEPEWKRILEKLIADNRADIAKILREYNVPLVDERGELLP
ncbi:MAG TPA: quinoprotein dehydrogenase-associated putative ABC transporter substrate-binding protein [Burkholderiales bacterium]|nr:quinoprotein dehydrogenase-associated putative ABC transporter substrate-binding protein [Burkholderiales bacterium]